MNMRAFKFDTIVSKDGLIQLPFTPSLFNKEVEIIIVPKTKDKIKKNTGKEFVKKWAGFLNVKDTYSSKLGYITEKYR